MQYFQASRAALAVPSPSFKAHKLLDHGVQTPASYTERSRIVSPYALPPEPFEHYEEQYAMEEVAEMIPDHIPEARISDTRNLPRGTKSPTRRRVANGRVTKSTRKAKVPPRNQAAQATIPHRAVGSTLGMGTPKHPDALARFIEARDGLAAQTPHRLEGLETLQGLEPLETPNDLDSPGDSHVRGIYLRPSSFSKLFTTNYSSIGRVMRRNG